MPAAYGLLALVLTWPLPRYAGTTLLGTIDPQLQAWNLAWGAHALLTDPAGIWQAPIFFPYPDTLAYADNFILLSALVAPLWWLTGNQILALNLLVLLSFALSGWAVYDLVRDVICSSAQEPRTENREPQLSGQKARIENQEPRSAARPLVPGSQFSVLAAAFLAGAAFAFGAYRMGHIVHLNLLQTMWLPWALLFLRRLLRPYGSWRDALLCGIFAGLQGATAIYYGVFAAALLGGYGALWVVGRVWAWLRRSERLPWRTLGLAGVAAAVAAAIAGPLLLPHARVYATLGIVRSVRELDNWSAPLSAYLSVPESNLLHQMIGLPFGAAGEFTLFPGLLVAALGCGALLLPHRWLPRRERLFWALVILGALVLSFGTGLRWERGGEPLPVPLPYVQLYTRLPGFGALRVPARWGLLVALALAVLAGVALHRLLVRLRGERGRLALGALALLLVLGETVAAPLPHLDPAQVASVPPVYPWLGAPEQADLRVVLELPAPKVPRGAELERITWRQLRAVHHWKQLPVAFSGLIPFGTTDLLGIVQRLPDEGTLRYLQLVGVDTLVVHTDEYPPEQLAPLVAAFDRSPLLRLRAEVGGARVYALSPFAELAAFAPSSAGQSIIISGDERLPGVLALALKRRWQEQGFALFGPGRVRYYGPLAAPQSGQVFAYGLLAADEDPAPYGFAPTGLRWREAGLAFYAADPALRANFALGQVAPGRFHPEYPHQLELEVSPQQLRVGTQTVNWSDPITRAVVELDLASLVQQTVTIGEQSFAIPPGGTTIAATISLDQPLTIAGQGNTLAIQRLRLRNTTAPAPPAPAGGMAATARVAFEGTRLLVATRAGGVGELVLDVWGAAAFDDKPVHLLMGAQPLAANGQINFELDLLAPAAPWLQHTAPAVDGRYEVYLRSSAQQAGRGLPIATFTLRGGQLIDPQPVPLPLTALPR